jgi:Dolichyl-phosphate-mannose-protein mannosyltransferase
VICTLLNAIKPLHIDDAAYYRYADQVARHPLDPYGFEIFWYQSPQPAFQVLAPPVLPYWWSCAIRLFGDRPFLWKLWLFPFSALFVFGLNGLARRFAPGLEGPLVWVTVLSPTFLPSFNLMLDVPSLALRLFGLLVFVQACERSSLRSAMIAGIVTGLAMETKYTGFLGLGAMALYAIFFRRMAFGLVAAAGASAVFCIWEGWTAWTYGESHFLYHWRHSRPNPPAEHMIDPLLRMLGGLAPYVTLFGLAALKRPAIAVTAAAPLMAVPYILIGLAPERDLLVAPGDMFNVLGFVQYVTLLVGAASLFREPDAGSSLARAVDNGRVGCFLISWTVLEIFGYFVLTPFVAVRRVMGPIVLATLLAGRLVSMTRLSLNKKALLHGIAVAGIGLGLLFYFVDDLEARAEKRAVERIVERPENHHGGTIWFVGHWGFQFYAEHAGMRPVVPGLSPLRRRDWLVVPDRTIDQQEIQMDPATSRLIDRIEIHDHVPLRTVPGYYDSWSSPFLAHRQGPRFTVQVYELMTGFTP